ncbi:sensor histidine kinase [Aminipila terrae]|uniref:histidine kinase n=1 Tax=Aminipila terrae TaxID=2697030 RepID=A0A6P1MKT2_9FIRM|nr:ATP-binding protein [Aminipila terrae]QHI73274.1 histidine kinase [Aminipila terrae]
MLQAEKHKGIMNRGGAGKFLHDLLCLKEKKKADQERLYMKKIKRPLLTAVCVSIGSQLYINVLTDGFIIALAVVIFGVCLHIFPELNPIKLSFLTGFCSPVFRCMVLWTTSGNLARSAEVALPDMIFYFIFGFIYYFLYYKNSNKNYTSFWTTLVVCDALSNTAELAFMNGLTYVNPTVIGTLFTIAMVRAVMILTVCLTVDYYKSLLKKEEHELRYKKLMVMASVFDSEVYFMKKGIAEIEDVMKKAYLLYQKMNNEAFPKELHVLTLDIAKDVHEIKKGYIRVIKGLQDNFLTDIKITSLNIRDLINILATDIEDLVKHKNKQIQFVTKVYSNFIVQEHYYLMSILRNIVVNAVDAIPYEKEGTITLELLKLDGQFYDFRITDNGSGIKKDDMDIIFAPGYSTKFDEATGDINRGLGLTLVKDLVEEQFNGSITVESQENIYTRFDILIPVTCFEEN